MIFIAAVGVVSLSAMTQGFLLRPLTLIERIIAVLITFALLMVDFKWRMVGLAVFAGMIIYQKMTMKKPTVAPAGSFASLGD